MNTLSYYEHEEIKNLLLGRKVTKVNDDTIELDNGTKVRFEGNSDCCVSYDLTELNEVDNIITDVEFVESPGGDEYEYIYGFYKIFVYAENRKINLVTFDGTDGNGYYGTGYYLHVSI